MLAQFLNETRLASHSMSRYSFDGGHYWRRRWYGCVFLVLSMLAVALPRSVEMEQGDQLLEATMQYVIPSLPLNSPVVTNADTTTTLMGTTVQTSSFGSTLAPLTCAVQTQTVDRVHVQAAVVTLNENVTTWPLADDHSHYRVPYVDVFPAQYPDTLVSKIRWAMKYIEQFLPVRFVPLTAPPAGHALEFRTGGFCATTVGRLKNVRNSRMVLDPDLCNQYELVLHEFLHLLGLSHEHARIDRDDVIQLTNVTPAYSFKTRICKDIVRHPYDLTSLLHYDAISASLNKHSEVYVVREAKYRLLGRVRRFFPSHCDWTILGYLYPDPKSFTAAKSRTQAPVTVADVFPKNATCNANCLPFGLVPTDDCKRKHNPSVCELICLLNPAVYFVANLCTFGFKLGERGTDKKYVSPDPADRCVSFLSVVDQLHRVISEQKKSTTTSTALLTTASRHSGCSSTSPTLNTFNVSVPAVVKSRVCVWCDKWTRKPATSDASVHVCKHQCEKDAFSWYYRHQRLPPRRAVARHIQLVHPSCVPPSLGLTAPVVTTAAPDLLGKASSVPSRVFLATLTVMCVLHSVFIN